MQKKTVEEERLSQFVARGGRDEPTSSTDGIMIHVTDAVANKRGTGAHIIGMQARA